MDFSGRRCYICWRWFYRLTQSTQSKNGHQIGLIMQRFAVFVSGFGSNLQAVIDAVKKGSIPAELALVFSNNPKAKGLERAKEAGIKAFFLDPKSYAAPQSYDREIVIQLKAEKIDFIVLADYMRMLTPWFVNHFPNKIINIHQSL